MKRDLLSSFRAKKAAVRYGHPSRSLQLVLVGGDGASSIARILAEIFRETGKRAAVFTGRGSQIEDIPYTPSYRQTATDTHRALAAARKQRCEVVVIALDPELEATGVLPTLHIDMVVLADQESASPELLALPLRYIVAPSGSDLKQSDVAVHQMITYGEDQTADARIEQVKLFRKGTEITLVIDHQITVELATFLLGYTNALRVSAAVAAAYVMGAPVEQLAEGVARTEAILGNFQYAELDMPYKVVVDDASTTSAVQALVRSARELARRRVLVVCDQSVEPGALAAIKSDVDRLVVVKGHSGMATDQADSLSDAVAITLRGAKLDDIVLLVGEELAEQVDEEQTRGARLVRGGSE